MFRIKLLILLLTSSIILSCTNNQNSNYKEKFSLSYIGGEYDGLLLKNYLLSDLKNLEVYDQNSNIEIKANISHSTNLYITNIDNTSDREKVSTKLSFQVVDTRLNCDLYKDEINISQFYIYASSDKFLSNQTALKKIKKDNTEATVKQLINKLKFIEYKCDE
tara:strand:- start:117 stop:605 length:489 start_codon:yes stop_codon:yes gene_type:complete